MFRWVSKLFPESKKHELAEWEKRCPECDGSGFEDIFHDCKLCGGNGVVKMTFKEKYNLSD